jgi:EAL domain-containing protein (putative c-di-GMP-specific phosphodiesterase class I)
MTKLWLATQPIVSWSQRATVGWEALLRSDHPGWGTPAIILGAAEQLERVRELSQRVRMLSAHVLRKVPPRARLWVNLHPSDLDDEDLYDLASPLSAVAERVVLEINENAQLERYADLKDRIQVLRQLGYMIAVDDLGSGYATLRSVAQLIPDIVKVDMGLIRNMDQDPMKGRVIRSLVTLCDQLGVAVVVEGVETPGELAAAIGMGCNLFQGFLFGRPDRALKVGQAHLSFEEEQHTAGPAGVLERWTRELR